MCEQCLKAAKRYFPKVKADDVGNLLFSATSFPFGSADDVRRQLRNLSRRKACNGTAASAIAIAHQDFYRDMRNMPCAT